LCVVVRLHTKMTTLTHYAIFPQDQKVIYEHAPIISKDDKTKHSTEPFVGLPVAAEKPMYAKGR